MINFKHRDEIAPSAMVLLSLLIMAGALAYMLLVPPPSVAGIARGRDRSRRAIDEEIARARARSKEAQAAAEKRLWTGDPDAVTAAVLARLTAEANQRALKLGAFRPQRQQALDELTELPFSVQIAGPYPAVRAFLATLDRPGTRLTARSIQIASSDSATDAVTATVGLSAYIAATAAPAATGGTRG